MNDDLPQFTDGGEGWMEITTAYDLSPFLFSIPVAVQVITGTRRVLSTGLLTSTEDQFASGSTDNDAPLMSVIYFRDAEPLRINWGDTKAVLAMVAVATGEEEEHGTGSQEAEEHGG